MQTSASLANNNLGSSCLDVERGQDPSDRRLLFSGDHIGWPRDRISSPQTWGQKTGSSCPSSLTEVWSIDVKTKRIEIQKCYFYTPRIRQRGFYMYFIWSVPHISSGIHRQQQPQHRGTLILFSGSKQQDTHTKTYEEKGQTNTSWA